jgi:hypothetical protein
MGFVFVGKLQLPSGGSPEPQLRETDSGIGPVGVTVTVKAAGFPAVTVAVRGETLIPKSLTVAVPCALGPGPVLSTAELLMGAGCGGITPVTVGTVEDTVKLTVAATAVVVVVPLVVVVIEVGMVPRLQTTVLFWAAAGQVPGLAEAETKVEFELRVSVKRTLATGSPVL